MNYQQAYEQAKSAGEVESLTPKFKDSWKKNEVLVGQYLGRHELISKLNQKPYYIYTLRTDNGPVRAILGTGVDQGEGPMMETGKFFALTYRGLEKIGGGQQMHRFEVEQFRPIEGTVVEAGDEVPI